MALIAMTPSDNIEYVSDMDPSKVVKTVPIDPTDAAKGTKVVTTLEDGATKFFLKSLDVFLMGHIYDNATSISGKQGDDNVQINTRMNQTNIQAVRHGLTGWDNFKDGKNNSVPFKSSKVNVNGRNYTVASDETMNLLGVQLIAELAQQIKDASEVAPSEEKN